MEPHRVRGHGPGRDERTAQQNLQTSGCTTVHRPSQGTHSNLRANKLAISVFDKVGDILDACCDAWNFFADDKEAIQFITTREWAATIHN